MTTPFYMIDEMARAELAPVNLWASTALAMLPITPLAYTPWARPVAAALKTMERLTRTYKAPAFNIPGTVEKVVFERPFVKVIRFVQPGPLVSKPSLLLVAPLSGPYPTLLRDTVIGFMPRFDVYITAWQNARDVPLELGRFDLDDQIEYLIDMMIDLAPDHVFAVCQGGVPALAALAVMEERGYYHTPRTMALVGSPIDARCGNTGITKSVEGRTIEDFEQYCTSVPPIYKGHGRRVCPGTEQLIGFLGLNLAAHVKAHMTYFEDVVNGNEDKAMKHEAFYDEYLAMLDLPAEYYMQVIDEVFIRHTLATGTMYHRGELVDLGAIRRTHLILIEGEKDDVNGKGATRAAVELCPNTRRTTKTFNAGHFGIFRGSHFRKVLVPWYEAHTIGG